MSDEQVQRALQMLAVSDRDREAPAEVEARLKQAFRRRRKVLAWRRTAVWTVAAAAAIIAVAVVREWRPKQSAGPVMGQVQSPAPVPPAVQPTPVEERLLSTTPRRFLGRRVQTPVPHEVVTEFFPLVDYAPPFERGELVRMKVPASAMRAVGLPVREDRLTDQVQADVLVGQEGVARAIRFVGYSVGRSR